MEREFPKNVKQIGNVSDEPKIYMEDYVDTYLNQLKEKAVGEPVAAVLTGEILKMNGQDVVYVAGALKLSQILVEGSEMMIGEETWARLEEEKKTFFSGQDMVGWCLLIPGQPMGLHRAINKIQEKYFQRENTVFVWRDAIESEEIFYANKFGELMQMGGHYIFYEKNPSMQSYMINSRKKIGVTPSEMVEDRAAKNFRSTVREKLEYKEQKQNSRFAYAMSVMLVLVVLVIGVSTMNNYDKMESVQNSLEVLSQAVGNTQAKTETVSEGDSEENKEVGQAEENVVEEDETDAVDTVNSEELQTEAEEIPDTKDLSEGEGSETVESDSASGNYYTVKKGDTLDRISRKMYGSTENVDAICQMNGLQDGNLIIIGQKLLLP